MFGSKG